MRSCSRTTCTGSPWWYQRRQCCAKVTLARPAELGASSHHLEWRKDLMTYRNMENIMWCCQEPVNMKQLREKWVCFVHLSVNDSSQVLWEADTRQQQGYHAASLPDNRTDSGISDALWPQNQMRTLYLFQRLLHQIATTYSVKNGVTSICDQRELGTHNYRFQDCTVMVRALALHTVNLSSIPGTI